MVVIKISEFSEELGRRMKQKAIAIDFDGVIHRFSKGWQDGSIYDPPIDGTKEALEKLATKGYRIVIHTTRFNHEINGKKTPQLIKELKKWLSRNGFEKGKHYHKITELKPQAVAYIDDKAIRFTHWQDVIKHFA